MPELKRLVAAARRVGPPWLHVFIRLQFETGSRVTEVLHLSSANVHWPTGTVSVRRLKSKAKKPRIIRRRLSNALLQDLKNLPGKQPFFVGRGRCGNKTRPGAAKVCPGNHLSASYVYRIFVVACRAAGVHEGLWKTHTLRHSALSQEAQRYKDEGSFAQEKAVESLGGHVSKESMKHYLHIDPERQQELETERLTEMETL